MSDFVRYYAKGDAIKALLTNGTNIIDATGNIALTLGAPSPGHVCVIRLAVHGSGTATVTTPADVLVGSGTGSTIALTAANERFIELQYQAHNRWAIRQNVGATIT
jgi:hypothetical protein